MMDAIENILERGYDSWKKNPILGLPFLLNTIINFIILSVSGFILLVVAGAMIYSGSSFAGSAMVFFAGSILALIFSLLTDSYFSAAAIGMAGKIFKSEEVSFRDIFKYGGEKVKDMF